MSWPTLDFNFGDINCSSKTYLAIPRFTCLCDVLNAHGALEKITTIKVGHYSLSRLARGVNLRFCPTQRGGGNHLVSVHGTWY